MEISWTDHVKNEVLLRVKEERNIVGKMKEGIPTGFITACAGTSL
jgi:hypothetical protein